MLQHYYTSCLKGTSGYAGFQVKAMSPGIPPEDLKIINGMISYHIPTSLDVNDIANHPIAFRYQYVRGNKCILVCSQSNGTDENGRPGNFFAHTVIADIRDFEVLPPIMFWRHPFWKSKDPSDQIEIPPQSNFDLSPSLEFDQIWPFLDTGQRRDWFYRLLSAVITYDKTKRPIVILDQADNVALWIACVSFALPNIFRPFLTFSTYEHDPYKSMYRIIGTRHDSRFSFSADEYLSFFILNTETGHISNSETSRAAGFICNNLRPDLYEERLSAFFAMCSYRLPTRSAAGMGEKLEAVTGLFLTVRDRSISVTEPVARQGLNLLINDLANRNVIEPEDLEDVQSAADLLYDALRSAPTSPMFSDYVGALRVLAKYDSSFPKRALKDMELESELILREQADLAEEFMRVCKDLYAETLLIDCVSQPRFLSNLATRLSKASCQVNRSIWKELSPFILVNTENREPLSRLIQSSFLAIDRLPEARSFMPPPMAENLLKTLQSATRNYSNQLWEIARIWREKNTSSILLWLYYQRIANLSLDERITYRRDLEKIEPNLVFYEFQRDINAGGIEQFISQIKMWITHTANEPSIQARLMPLGLTFIWEQLQKTQRINLAEKILASDFLSPHTPDEWTTKLLTSYLADARIAVLDAITVRIYSKYSSYSGLTSDQVGLIGGSLAMTARKFYDGTIPGIRKRLANLDEVTYQTEVDKLFHQFFMGDPTLQGHIEMLQATYVPSHSSAFWGTYWNYIRELLFDTERTSDLIQLLSFWFDDSPRVFSEFPYLVQSFFLQLPSVMEQAKEDKGTAKDFRRVAQFISAQAGQKPWYFMVEPFLAEKKKKFLGIG